MSNSLQPHESQQARPPCPSPTPRGDLSQHQGLFKLVSSLHQVAKYWSFSISISPSSEYSELISFRMDWLDLNRLSKSFLQHHSSKASILRYSAFFTVQLSHPYMTNGKTIALTRWTFVGKVMSLNLITHDAFACKTYQYPAQAKHPLQN